MNSRRSSDLDDEDLDILIKLAETRMHTITLHLNKNSFADNNSLLKSASAIQRAVFKLKRMKERKGY